MFCVDFSITITFIYGINGLVFITEKAFVYCAVRAETSSIIRLIVVLKAAIPLLRQLVGGLSPRKGGFDLVSFPVGFVVDRVALGQFFSSSNSVLPCWYDTTNNPCCSSCTCCCYLKEKRAKLRILPNRSAL